MVRQQHDRTDFVALLSADVPSIAPFASVEVRRRAGRGALAAGASFVVRTPQSAIVPPPGELGPNYQRLIAPALAYDVAEASASAAWLTMRWPVRGTVLVGGVRAERASATTENAARLQPVGTRGGGVYRWGSCREAGGTAVFATCGTRVERAPAALACSVRDCA